MKKMLTATIAAAVLALGAVGVAPTAEAKDSGWGCGGAC